MLNQYLISQTEQEFSSTPRIKVLGLGGAGCNTIRRLSALQLSGIELLAANTDQQSLAPLPILHKILLGTLLTKGLGSGGLPEIGKTAAEESYRQLIDSFRDCDLLFLTAGMGGGTGSGAIQIAARIAKSLDIPTISIVTIPFAFEAGQRQMNACQAIAELQPFTDTLIAIPNERLLKLASADTTLEEAFSLADDILLKGIRGISELFNPNALLGVDLSHVLRLMRDGQGIYISIGEAEGENHLMQAIENALSHPLLEDLQIQQAKGLIVKFNGNVNMADLGQALRLLRDRTSPQTEILPAVDPSAPVSDKISVTLLVSGVGATGMEYPQVSLQPAALPRNAENQVHIDLPSMDSLIPDEQILAFSSKAFEPALKDPDDLEVPAFIRRGYNLLEISEFHHGS